MKQLAFALLLTATCSFAQQTPTTEEEFNYATKGYHETVEKGLDVKQGYMVQQIGTTFKSNTSSFTMHFLIRKQKNELAGIIVIGKDYIGRKMVTCIPVGDTPALQKRYYSDVSKWDSGLVLLFAQQAGLSMTNLFAATTAVDKRTVKK